MDLPRAAQAYFEADRNNDQDAVVRTFAANAIVTDEGDVRAGHEAIRTWWVAAKGKYEHLVEPLTADETDDGVRVGARVSGNFAGSPAILTFSFLLDDEKILGLEIRQ